MIRAVHVLARYLAIKKGKINVKDLRLKAGGL